MKLDADSLLRAYAMGIFPMAESRDATEVQWVTARLRGVFPLESFHVSQSLARHIRRHAPEVTTDRAFADVVRACADRPETWINATIFEAYLALHARGHAHSLEIWQEGELVGGVYGVTLGAAFFGESMFSRRVNGSKMALAYLVQRLRAGGFLLFDTQFLTPHLASLGAEEIPKHVYEARLQAALAQRADFDPEGYVPQPPVAQARSQTS
jgi:leucyl/phenylalanyl-tRNA--protein transferase